MKAPNTTGPGMVPNSRHIKVWAPRANVLCSDETHLSVADKRGTVFIIVHSRKMKSSAVNA